ncbi:hypothetical protein ISN45_Aa05g014830 [Arabidopsis thaliana x Arabidopsis arenosa]|uniref:Uncharacterized protein n=2 Tax=Arabidopsis TaxID=3701 RepID=A0A8T1ZYX0_ARASU|nr:hypothetical protein ISN45_Aa05g014830 [Arabidopsis thaliana x Arabidopsis arenosa]KAG7564719.1 hypothetical protein ISN44_As10g014720 [Arabidopsis suecica]
MPMAAIVILAFAAVFWVLVSYSSGGNNNVSKKIDTRPSGIGTGSIFVIILALMAMMVLNNNAEQIRHDINDQADGIWILVIIFFCLFMLYLKGGF